MQIHARYACSALYKAAGQKKGPKKEKRQAQKKPLVGQRLCGINALGGMQNRNGPASDVLLLVRAVHQVLFPAVAVR